MKHKILFILPWTLTIVFALSTAVLLLFHLINKGSFSLDYHYSPQELGPFTQLDCDYVLGDKLGWSTYDAKNNMITLSAQAYNTATTTVVRSSQQMKIGRVNDKEITVAVFVSDDQDLSNQKNWSIQDESAEGLVATNTLGSSLSLSKKSGLAIYTRTVILGTEVVPSVNQESTMFSCQTVQ